MTIPYSVTPPNIPLATDAYDRKAEDQRTNVHKQFYNSVSNAVNFCLNNGVFNEATANTTGTWNPVIGFGSPGSLNSAAQTLIYVAGEYQLFGDYVLATWQFIFSNKGTSVGGAYVRGLPFPTTNQTVGAVGLSTYAVNMTGLTGSITVYPASDIAPSTDLPIYQWNPNGIGQVFDTNFTNTTAFYGGVIYPRV
jgi:hypothetical protein